MAKNSFSLNTVLKLNSKEFQKGVKQVQNSLKGLVSSFRNFAASIGAGLGVYQLISQLKQATIEMNTAKAVLKNVSVETNDAGIAIDHYAENLAYVKRLARDYKQDQAGLIDGFAKFTSACRGTNVALEEQKVIYESLVRASAYFHLSADETNGVMVALQQMMSKGKVTAEELRRQLGNSLPGAFNIMAAAMGVTTSQFEDMMKNGQVLSAEALPKFARELNKLTANLETSGALDSLQLNLNALKNAFKDFADNSGFEGFLNSITKLATNALNGLTNNIHVFKHILNGLLVSIPAGLAFNALKKNGEAAFKSLSNEAERLENKLKKFQKRYNVDLSKSTGVDNIGFFKNLDRIPTLQERSQYAKIAQKDTKAGADYLINTFPNSEKAIKEVLAYRNALNSAYDNAIKLNQVQKEMGTAPLISDEQIKKIERVKNAVIRIGEDGKIALEEVKQQTTATSLAMRGLTNVVKSLGTALKAAFSTLIFTAILTLLTSIISALKKFIKESIRIKNIVNDTKDAAEEYKNAMVEEEAKVKGLLKIAEDTERTDKERLKAISEIGKIIGKEIDDADTLEQKYQKIAEAVKTWAERQKTVGLANYYSAAIASTQGRIDELNREAARNEGKIFDAPIRRARELVKLREKLDWLNEQLLKTGIDLEEQDKAYNNLNANKELTDAISTYEGKLKKLNNQRKAEAISQKEYNEALEKAKVEAYQAATGIDGLDKETEKLSDSQKKLWDEISGGYKKAKNALTKNTTKDPLLETVDRYNKAIEELQNKRDNGIITEKDFDRGAIQAAKDAWEALSGIAKVEDKMRKLGKGELFDKIFGDYEKSKLTDIQDIFDEYEKNLKELQNQRDNGTLSQYQYDEAVKELNIELAKTLSKIDDIDKKAETLGKKEIYIKAKVVYAEDIKDKVKELQIQKPEYKPRDTSLDYKKNQEQIAKEELENFEDYIKRLDDYIEAVKAARDAGAPFEEDALNKIKELEAALKSLKESVPELEVKVKIAAAEDSIKKLKKDLVTGIGSGIKNLATDMDRVIRSVENITDVFEDEDSTGWEKFITVFNALAQAVEVVTSTMTAFNSIMTITKDLDLAKQAKEQLAATITQATAQETADAAALAALTAKIAETKTLVSLLWDSVAALVAEKAVLTEGISLATSAGYIAAAKTMTKGAQAFANGGIVKGSSYSGDKVLARVNSGEMLLNKGQQANLFKMLNNGGTGGEVKFEIDGTKLVGVLNNYNRKRKGK